MARVRYTYSGTGQPREQVPGGWVEVTTQEDAARERQSWVPRYPEEENSRMGSDLMVVFHVYVDDDGAARWHAYAYDWQMGGLENQPAEPVITILGAHSQQEAAESMGQAVVTHKKGGLVKSTWWRSKAGVDHATYELVQSPHDG